MITPRQTRLVAVEGFAGMRAALSATVLDSAPDSMRDTAILVPTRTAAELLRRTIESRGRPHQAFVLPDILTRGEWYAAMHARLGVAPPVLSALEREVLAEASAREAASGGDKAPFRLRPGLLSEVLALYDTLGRHRRSLDDFERNVFVVLGQDEAIDRGAARLMRQTRFFLAMLRAYERRRDATGGIDEQGLRALLLATDRVTYRHVVVTVGDRQSSPPGLYDADFDLLTRLAGVDRIDLVATEAALSAGLRLRLNAVLPGIEEVRGPGGDAPGGWPRPHLAAPSTGDALLFLSRDREQEVAEVVRDIKRAGATPGALGPLDRVALVFRRPLPYVYVARTLFENGRVPCQATDALPLAAEPVAAALDLVFAAVSSGFTRDAVVALAISPHWRGGGDGQPSPADVAALDRALDRAGFLGGAPELKRIAGSLTGGPAAAGEVACEMVAHLEPLTVPSPATSHLGLLEAFFRRFERIPASDDPVFERHARARAAILSAIVSLGDAHRRLDDPVVAFDDLAATIRRWIESQTFTPRAGSGGVQLVDAEAAPYADLDQAYLVGLVAGEWEESEPRNIFYPSSILCQLGWPTESVRLASARAAFLDLVRSPRVGVRVSSFSLENDAIVEPSPLAEDLDRADLDVRRLPAEPAARVLVDEGLATEPLRTDLLAGPAQEWAALRTSRTPARDARFHGRTAAAPGGQLQGHRGGSLRRVPVPLLRHRSASPRGGARRSRGTEPARRGAVRARGAVRLPRRMGSAQGGSHHARHDRPGAPVVSRGGRPAAGFAVRARP